jgi:hypothetical protein
MDAHQRIPIIDWEEMFTTKPRTPAIVAVSIFSAAIVCLTLAGCSAPHYNHRGETIPGTALLRIVHPTIITRVTHVRGLAVHGSPIPVHGLPVGRV